MIKGVVINMIKLLHYAMVYSSRVLLDKLNEYHKSYKRSYNYVHKPRYIKPGRDINMDTSGQRPKWDKKSAPYCETP